MTVYTSNSVTPGKIVDSKEEIISYQKLRTFIGLIGFFLPIVLVVGSFILGAKENSWQPSISHYYYSKMHIIFLCALCVLGGFLITYKGKPDVPWESRISNLAGYAAISIAAFPTPFEGFQPKENGTNQYLRLITDVSPAWGRLHFISAGILFGCFILFCWVFFQKPDGNFKGDQVELKKFKKRKVIYKICGWGILISIILLAAFMLYKERYSSDSWKTTTFWFETTSLWFFGTAWLVKGSEFWSKLPAFNWFMKAIR